MVQFFRGDDVAELLTMEDALACVDEAFRLLASGDAMNKPRQRVRADKLMLHVLPAGSSALGYVGRAVVALATDTEVKRKTGRVFSSWGLVREYGFKDADGRQPNWGEHFEKTYEMQNPSCDDAFYAHWEKSPIDAVFPD